MKKFNVNVNGTVYSVEVEEVGGTVAAAPVAPAGQVLPPPPHEGRYRCACRSPGHPSSA